MEQRRHYRVADHLFSIQAETDLLDMLTNYAPFLTTDEGGEVFNLSVGEVALPEDRIHVFTDTSDDDMPRIEVYRTSEQADAEWLFLVSMYKDSPICTRLLASHDFSEARLQLCTADTRFSIDNAAMLLYAFATAHLYTLEMHASVTVKDGLGYLFLGKSGTGKSTHSRMWMEAFDDARLLNDDNPILRIVDDRVYVYGSPWSGKTPCYVNRHVPVGAIVKLSQAPHNSIHALRLPEAYAYMLSSASGLKIVPAMMDALYDTISHLIQMVQVYGMECLPDNDAARVCHAAVAPK